MVVMSACSGHGFKFAPRLGRAVADLIDGVYPKLPDPKGYPAGVVVGRRCGLTVYFFRFSLEGVKHWGKRWC